MNKNDGPNQREKEKEVDNEMAFSKSVVVGNKAFKCAFLSLYSDVSCCLIV